MDHPRSKSAGGIVLGDGGTIAMVQSKGGNGAWLFPKGHVEAGETDEEAARREIKEETGLDNLEFIDDLGAYERFAIDAYGQARVDVLKEIHMYLFAAEPHALLAPEMTKEIGAAVWVPYQKVADTVGNEKDRIWYASVFQRVRQAIQRD